ncbi:MAG TPA: triose-phosphate isomerase family protein [Galbitalea sp.]|nr:triose-phosphate isomerase family protein [Galbitalea sp.]
MGGTSPLFIGASTKAYLGYATTVSWLRAARAALLARPELDPLRIQPFVAPSTPLLLKARRILADTSCWVGAQDGQWQSGPATGAVSMTLLAELGMDFVELGHAERQRVFGETVDETGRKAVAAAEAGLTLLFCVGEPEQTTADAAAEHCVSQVRSALSSNDIALDAVMLAYEPWWAIGADRPAQADYVNDVLSGTRSGLVEEFGQAPLGILYGGSAGPGTLAPLSEADGLFLGRFAHEPANYARVLDEAITRQAG